MKKTKLHKTHDFYSEVISDYPILGLDKSRIAGSRPAGLKSPSWVNRGPLYEIYIRAFSDQGDIKSVIDKIPYIKNLGIKTIWLMPIYPIGVKGRKGRLGSPYSIRNYYQVNPEYGALEDVKKLVACVHDEGMNIILDLVANHVANDYTLIGQNDDLFLKNDAGKLSRKIADWTDVTDLDYSHPATHRHMTDITRFWLKEIGFDGFRCDVAGLVPDDFWNNLVLDFKKNKPDFFMLAEWESPHLHVDSFHATYDWILYFLLRDVARGLRPATDALKWVEVKKEEYPDNALPMRFLENHDMPRAADWFGREGVKAYAAFIFSIYGLPLIYAGQEFGETMTPSLFEKTSLDWENADQALRNYYRRLIRLRKRYAALSSRELIMLDNDQPHGVLSYLKKDNGHHIYCLINLSGVKAQTKVVNLPFSDEARLINMINEESVKIKNGVVTLWPYQAIYIDGEKL